MSGHKGKEKMKDRQGQDRTILKARTDKARQREKARKVKKPESVTNATSLDICDSVYKKRIAEKRHKEKVETSAAVQGAMVETWEYDEDDCRFSETRDAHLHWLCA